MREIFRNSLQLEKYYENMQDRYSTLYIVYRSYTKVGTANPLKQIAHA